MVTQLRNNNPYVAFLLFLYCTVIRIPALLSPKRFLRGKENLVVYNDLADMLEFFLGHHAFLITLIAVFSVFFQSLFLRRIAAQAKLAPRSGYLIPFVFINLSLLNPAFAYFSVAHILTWLLLVFLHEILKLSRSDSPKLSVYNAAFALACMPVLQFSCVALLPLIFLAVWLLRPLSVKEMLIALLGVLTPLYFFASYLFITGSLLRIKAWPLIGVNLPAQLANPAAFFTVLAVLTILLLLGLHHASLQFSRMTIDSKRKWWILLLAIPLCLLAAMLGGKGNEVLWLLPVVPISILGSYALLHEKYKRMNNFVFYFIIALVLFSLNFG